MLRSSNLALRPFRNERLPWLLAWLLLLGSIGLSVSHARFVDRLLSGSEANTVQLVRADEARISELEGMVAKEPPLRLESAELARLHAIKDLVDRRVFPWRRLLADFEELLSADVRLVRITPAPSSKDVAGIKVELAGEARTKDAAFSFAESLESSAEFSEVVLKSMEEEERGIKFTLESVFDASAANVGSTGKASDGLPAPGLSPTPLPRRIP